MKLLFHGNSSLNFDLNLVKKLFEYFGIENLP